MRAFRLFAVSALVLVAAGCGWKPPGGPQAAPDTCTPAQGPAADTVNQELTKLPAPAVASSRVVYDPDLIVRAGVS